jgi:protease-4
VSLETDLILDRRRLKRRLLLWRVLAFAAVLIAVVVSAQPWRGVGRHVARISVSGIITDDRRLTDRIDALGRDRSVPAVIVAIDSPGGSVGGGEALHAALARLAARKPVVAVMRGTAASAGYMAALPAHRIFARDSTLTGSIGVILQTGEVSGLLDKLGIHADAITSGPLKDQPSFTRPLTPQGHDYLQGLVGDLYAQFVAMVAAGRHMDPARVRELADGRAYTGRQAIGLGLVDEIGGEPEARAWLAREKQVPEALPIQDERMRGLVERTVTSLLPPGLVSLLAPLASGTVTPAAWAIWQAP